jgi:hypothetical protein
MALTIHTIFQTNASIWALLFLIYPLFSLAVKLHLQLNWDPFWFIFKNNSLFVDVVLQLRNTNGGVFEL